MFWGLLMAAALGVMAKGRVGPTSLGRTVGSGITTKGFGEIIKTLPWERSLF